MFGSTGGGFSFGTSTPQKPLLQSSTSTGTGLGSQTSGFSFGGFGTTTSTTNTTNTPATANPGFSFTSNTTNTQQPATNSFGFGTNTTPATNTSSFGGFTLPSSTNTATTSSGLFSFSAPSTTSTTNPSLFGNAPTTSTGSLFGNPGSSLFGSSSSSSSLFGNNTTANTASLFKPSLFSSTTFGNASTGVATTLTPAPTISISTRYSELPEAVKNALAAIESAIVSSNSVRDETQTSINGRFALENSVSKQEGANTASGPKHEDKNSILSSTSLSAFSASIASLRTTLERSQTSLQSLADDAQRFVQFANDASRAWRKSVHTNEMPQGLYEPLLLPSPFHWHMLSSMESRVRTLTEELNAVEDLMSAHEQTQTTSQHPQQYSAQAICSVCRSQHAALIQIAARIARLNEQSQLIKEAFVRGRRDIFVR